ncbi:MAG TPA: hypothetical protein VK630_01020 [Reyranella sp.]|nr:hypothetical protein [Reyranella sp.]
MVLYRTFLVLGLAVGTLGAGYIFAPQPGGATVATAPMPKAAGVATAATPAAPTAKPASTLVANRAPVPLAARTHNTYFAPKESAVPGQTASATTGAVPSGATTTDISNASLTVGAGLDGGLPPAPGEAKSGDSAQAKAAVELDGYKNVRGLEKGADGIWRGRAMRGRTEIAIRVDASGSVSAD